MTRNDALKASSALTTIRLSTEQLAIAREVDVGFGNIMVQARAGTGKTFLILQCVPLMKPTLGTQGAPSIAIIAFNRKIADEIAGKARRSRMRNVVADTFHHFGGAVLRKLYPAAKKEGKDKGEAGFWKWDRIVEQLQVPEYLKGFVKKAMSMGMQRGLGVVCPLNDKDQWLALVQHFGLDTEVADDNVACQLHGKQAVIQRGIQLACKAIKLGVQMAHEVYSFDDMLYLPLVLNAEFDKYDWVCIDEAQDSNILRQLIAVRMTKPGGRRMWVGDECQPLGTMVRVPAQEKQLRGVGRRGAKVVETTEVPIEDLEVGEKVVSFDQRSCAFVKLGRAITGITRRPYNGDLVVVSTERGQTSRYTLSHHCVVNYKALMGKFGVYIMQRGNQFRIGKSKLEFRASSGLSNRMHWEHADAVWLLSVHDTEAEAYFQEQAVSARFGLPQLCFNHINLARGPAKEYLPRAWEFIGDNSERALACLAYFGRLPACPLFTRGTGKQQTLKRPFVTAAANVVDGCLVLPFDGGAGVHVKASDWQQVKVRREFYSGDVVSLDVSGEHVYVADNILTHNCQAINGFAGAMNDALDQITAKDACVSLKMTVTFRCGKAIVAKAQALVPDYRAADSNPDGIVREIEQAEFNTTALTPDDAIICRNTQPLIRCALGLIRRGIACHVEGRDIGRNLLKVIARFDNYGLGELQDRLRDWRDEQVEKYMKAKQEARAEECDDTVATIFALIEGLGQGATVGDLKAKINSLFADTKTGERPKTVTLLTAHKSKGLEFKRVFGWGVAKYFPSRFAKQDWQLEQEMHLEYVLYTRAIEEYVDVFAE